MNRIYKLLSIAFLIITLASAVSCNEGKPSYSSFVTVLTKDGPGAGNAFNYPYFFVSDDSLKLYPINHADLANYKPKDNSRALVFFYDGGKFEDASTDGSAYNIEIFDLGEILVKDILFTEKIDTTGINKASPLGMWCSGGIYGAERVVNIKFEYLASQYSKKTHTINLVQDLKSETPVVDKDGYYCLEFRHNANQEIYDGFSAYGYVSFPLTGEMIKENVIGLKIKFPTINDGDKEYKVKY